MTTDQPALGNRVPNFLRFEWVLVVSVIVGAFGVGFTGLYASFDTVGLAAKEWGFDPPWILPVAIDVSIPVFSLAHLLMIRADMPMAGVRVVPWALTAVTVYLNVSAVPDGLLAPMLGHGALPLLWVVCSEIAAHVYKSIIGRATGRRMERVRRSRWFLSPVPTFLLWRRMILWEITSYEVALLREQDRLLARAALREEYGWRWRSKTPRQQRVLLRLGELAPDAILATPGDTATGELLATVEVPELATADTVTAGDSTPTTSAKRVLTCDSVAGDSSRQVLTATAVLPDPQQLAATGDNSGAPFPVQQNLLGDNSWIGRQEACSGPGDRSEAGDNSATTGDGDGSELSPRSGSAGDDVATAGDLLATAGDRTGEHRQNGRKVRRSMEEWVELAAPVFHEEFTRRRKQPTAEQFADAIEEAGFGKVSPSTAKNIRTAILDDAELPVLA